MSDKTPFFGALKFKYLRNRLAKFKKWAHSEILSLRAFKWCKNQIILIKFQFWPTSAVLQKMRYYKQWGIQGRGGEGADTNLHSMLLSATFFYLALFEMNLFINRSTEDTPRFPWFGAPSQLLYFFSASNFSLLKKWATASKKCETRAILKRKIVAWFKFFVEYPKQYKMFNFWRSGGFGNFTYST